MTDFTGGELVARVLKQAGVGHVFTLCGGHILPIYDGCLTEGIRVIDVRHEQAAAHAADAYARLTRNVGVAVVTAGPGRDHRDADVLREPRVRVGGVGGRLLVAEVDDPDAFGEAAVVDRQDVPAAQREHVAHASLPQRARDEFATRQIAHITCPLISDVSPINAVASRARSPSPLGECRFPKRATSSRAVRGGIDID